MQMKTLFIDFHIHTVYSQEICAHLSIKETLDYYQTIGNRAGQRVIIRVNDHNNFYGGVRAVEYYLEHKHDYPNIFVIPGIEFSANLGYVLKYKKNNITENSEFPYEDDKYDFIFKKAHIGAAPILKDRESFEKWKNNKDLQVYSKLSKMFLDRTIDEPYHMDNMAIPQQVSARRVKNYANLDLLDKEKTFLDSPKYKIYPIEQNEKDMILYMADKPTRPKREQLCNTGDQIIASKNLIRKKFGVIIPYAYLESCTEEGMTHSQIINQFIELSTDYMRRNYLPFKTLKRAEVKNKLISFYKAEKSLDMRYILPFDQAIFEAVERVLKFYEVNLSPKEIANKFINSKKPREERLANIYFELTKLVSKYSPKQDIVNPMKRVYRKIVDLTQNLFDKKNECIYFGGLRKIHFDELCDMVTKAGGIIDIEHPDKGFEVHKDKKIPFEVLSSLKYNCLRYNDWKTVRKKLAKHQDMTLDELLGEGCELDSTGLVKIQLLKYGMKQNGIKLNNDQMGVEITKYTMKNTRHLNNILRIMGRNNLLVNYGSDKHLNILDYYVFSAKDKEYKEDYHGDKKIIDEDYLRQLHQEIKAQKGLHDKFEEYNVTSKVKNVVKRFDYSKNKLFESDCYENLVKQSSFCDAVLGKEVKYVKDQPVLTLNLGGEIKQNDDTPSHSDIYSDMMVVVYKDIQQTVEKLGKDNFSQLDIKKLKEDNKNYMKLIKENYPFLNEEDASNLLGKIIVKNRKNLQSLCCKNFEK